MILVSGCLTGQACRYNGQSKSNLAVLAFIKDHPYLTFCPEIMGGLTVPRRPSEVLSSGLRVITDEGQDVTEAFEKGAALTLQLAKDCGCQLVIAKEGSPSCGVGWIYDGTFSGQKIPGRGVTIKRLQEAGYRVISEEEVSYETL